MSCLVRDSIKHYGQEESVVPACLVRLKPQVLALSLPDIKLHATARSCVDAQVFTYRSSGRLECFWWHLKKGHQTALCVVGMAACYENS